MKKNANNKDSKNTARNSRYAGRGGRKPTAFEKGIDDPSTYINTYTQSKNNDPAWYMVNTKLVNSAAKIPTGNMVGERLALNALNKFSIPAIATVKIAPCIGYSRDSTSAPSRMAVAVTEYLRSKLTTDESFEAPDVLMYLNAADSIFSLYSHIARLFGLASYVQFNNKFTPKALVQAIYDFSDNAWDDLIQNKANYLKKFEQYVLEAQFLYVPTKFTAMERHSWLFTNVFTDSNSNKAQLYAHKPQGFYVWDEISHDTGTSNVFLDFYNSDSDANIYHRWTQKYKTTEGLLELFHKMCYAMINSTSQMRIRMSFLKAYENEPGWRMMTVSDNYIVTPVHSDEVLTQINNATIDNDLITQGYRQSFEIPDTTILPDGGAPFTTKPKTHPLDITQDPNTNTVYCTPFILDSQLNAAQKARYGSKNVINFHWDDPSVEDIVVATRNLTCYELETYPLNQPAWNLTGMGVDVITEFDMYWFDDDDNSLASESIPKLMGTASGASTLQKMFKWACFDWAPAFWLFKGSASSPTELWPVQEWDNYVPIDNSTLEALDAAVLTSMYQVKEAGMYAD